MQNNPKTERHMHSNPQMRIRLQLFLSTITINLFSTAISLRSSCNVFTTRYNRCDDSILVDRLTRGVFLMKKRRKISIIACGRVGQAFCNRPKPKLLLQDNGCMIKWIERKAATSIVGKDLFWKYISFTQPYNSWICREKKRILNCSENSCFKN